MENITIKIDGKEYQPGRQKAKFWRKLAEFEDNKSGIEYNSFIDAHAEIIAEAFANPNVTAERIVENYDIDEIIPLFQKVAKWFYGLIHSKFVKIPNEQTAAE